MVRLGRFISVSYHNQQGKKFLNHVTEILKPRAALHIYRSPVDSEPIWHGPCDDHSEQGRHLIRPTLLDDMTKNHECER